MDNNNKDKPPKELPPHPPADMLDMYMTRYDYDYGRDPDGTINNNTNNNNNNNNDEEEKGVSGDVRNRPIFAMHTQQKIPADSTTYRHDYNPDANNNNNNNEKDFSVLTRAAQHLLQDQKGGTLQENINVSQTHRRGPSSGMTTHLYNTHPETVYQQDYLTPNLNNNNNALNNNNTNNNDRAVYAGASAAVYNEKFLLPGEGVPVDDGSDIAPKVGSEEAMKKIKESNKEDINSTAAAAARARTPTPPPIPNDNDNNDDDNNKERDYTVTSSTYGDVRQAHPSQLPVGVENSRNAHLIASEREPAKRLALLAGRRTPTPPPNNNNNNNNFGDTTNPVFMNAQEKKTAAVSRRLETEGFNENTTYRSDFHDPHQLPELPGNHIGSSIRATHLNYTATAGEMMGGTLTRETREMGTLRNTHGTLKKDINTNNNNKTISAEGLKQLREREKELEVDKADPHRHRLRQ